MIDVRFYNMGTRWDYKCPCLPQIGTMVKLPDSIGLLEFYSVESVSYTPSHNMAEVRVSNVK